MTKNDFRQKTKRIEFLEIDRIGEFTPDDHEDTGVDHIEQRSPSDVLDDQGDGVSFSEQRPGS